MKPTAQIHKEAHDPGDPQITSHCPFCGSGQIVGRSDGTIECDFCGMNYIVRVQPAFPGMPQGPGMMGAPTDVGPEMGPGGEGMMGPDELGPDGMPLDGEEGGFPPEDDGGFPPEAEDDEDDTGAPPFGGGDDSNESDESGDKEEPKGKGDSKKKPPSKKEGVRYRTIAGAELPEGAYLRHLAILHSGGRADVLRRVRAENAASAPLPPGDEERATEVRRRIDKIVPPNLKDDYPGDDDRYHLEHDA